MIFLPASLVSSIFGMGFFNTSPRPDGSAEFTISKNWWWYLAIAIPVTLALWVYMVGYRWYTRENIEKNFPSVNGRSGSESSDVEAQTNVEAGKKDT